MLLNKSDGKDKAEILIDEWKVAKAAEPKRADGVSRADRDFVIKALRMLFSGGMDNLQFDDICFDCTTLPLTDAAACDAVGFAWYFYDDFIAHPVLLEKEGREVFARMILFLYSDIPCISKSKERKKAEKEGYFPFPSMQAFEDAKKKPVFLFDGEHRFKFSDTPVTLPKGWECRRDKALREYENKMKGRRIDLWICRVFWVSIIFLTIIFLLYILK